MVAVWYYWDGIYLRWSASGWRTSEEEIRKRPCRVATSQIPSFKGAAGLIKTAGGWAKRGTDLPIFEYICASCGKIWNILLLNGDSEPKRCEACGSGRTKRLMSGFSVRTDSSRSDEAALRYRPREFLEDPSKFEKTMKSIQKRSGVKIRGEQVDDAMHRLSNAKRKK